MLWNKQLSCWVKDPNAGGAGMQGVNFFTRQSSKYNSNKVIKKQQQQRQVTKKPAFPAQAETKTEGHAQLNIIETSTNLDSSIQNSTNYYPQ